MGNITQSTSAKAALLWVGICEDEVCEDFDLMPYVLGGVNEGIIGLIYQVGSNNTGSIWKGNQPSTLNNLNAADFNDPIGNKLLCGSCYYIQLAPASAGQEEVLDVPGAMALYADESGKGRIFDRNSSKPQFLGDISNLPSCITKGDFQNLITDADPGIVYSTAQTITPDRDGVYLKTDGTVHRFFGGMPFEIPAGSKLLKGNFGILDTDGDGVPDTHDLEPNSTDRFTNQYGNAIVVDVASNDTAQSGLLIKKSDGSLWTYGTNQQGEQGLGSFGGLGKSTPVLLRAAGLPGGDVTHMAVGYHHRLFAISNGNIYGFGFNRYGQLGNGEPPIATVAWDQNAYDKHTPTHISIAQNLVGLEAGWDDSFFITGPEQIHGVGRNEYGQYGDGSTQTRNSFTSNSFPAGHGLEIKKVCAGRYFTIFLSESNGGTVWATGRNNYGQLGDGTTDNSLSWKQVEWYNHIPLDDYTDPFENVTLPDVVDIATQENSSHVLILLSDGKVLAWGNSTANQLSAYHGTTPNSSYGNYDNLVNNASPTTGFTPTPIVLVDSDVIDISVSSHTSCWVTSDGTAWYCGGYSSYSFNLQPMYYTHAQGGRPFTGITDVARVFSGNAHVHFLKTDGTLWGVGDHRYDGSSNIGPDFPPYTTPVRIM